MAIATPATVVTPEPILSDSPPLLLELPDPVAPAPVAVAVPLPMPLAVLFVDELPAETAGRPCTLIVLQLAALFVASFPEMKGRNERDPVDVNCTNAWMEAAYVLEDFSVGPASGRVELFYTWTQ